MQEEIKKATLAIIHYGLDLWTCKVAGRHGIQRGLNKAGGREGLGLLLILTWSSSICSCSIRLQAKLLFLLQLYTILP